MFKASASNDGTDTTLSRGRGMLRASTALCAVILVLSIADGAKAADVNWTGGAGNWTDSTKWTSTTPSGNRALIGGTTAAPVAGQITINSAVDANAIIIGGGSDLHIVSGGTLTTIPAANASNNIGQTGFGDTTNATMTIDAGGIWQAGQSGVRVGNGANGVLTVGGTLHMTNGLLAVGGANLPGGNGTLNIDGGTVTNDSAALRAGYSGGTGTVNITNGGTLTTSTTGGFTLNAIGDGTGTAPGTGFVNISGTGSSWTIGAMGGLVLGTGAGAQGTLAISNGGKFSYESSRPDVPLIGQLGGTGIVTVDGAGSLFENKSGSGLTLGNGAGATGTMTLSNGGTANITGPNNVIVGYQTGTGTLNASSGGTFNSESSIYVGNGGGTGTLNVTNDGKVNVTAGGIEFGAGGNATGLVDGQGSTITTSTGMAVGNQGATGTLTVSNGGVVTSANGWALIGGNNGTGTLNVTSGGKVFMGDSLSVGWGQGTGTASVIGAGSSIEVTNRIEIGLDTGTGASTGTLTVADGATIKAANILVGFETNGSGTLNIGNGGAAGIVNGEVTMGGNSSVVNFNHNQSNYVFANVIDERPGLPPVNGSVNFIGSGTTTLTAVNTYTSATNINAGTLVIASGASIANSVLTTVNSGGTLAGAGAVGNVSVASGGTIAPTGFNTLTVKDITFAAGSTYQVGISAAGQTGGVAANTATLNGGTVQVNAGSGNYAPGTTYTILSTSGGVTGQFADLVSTNLVFLNADLDYADPNKVNLALTRNGTSFASVAATANQRATATGIGSLPASNPVYAAVVQQSVPGARAAFDALTGEAHASAQGTLINNALVVGDTINSRLARSFASFAPVGTPSPSTGFAEEAPASLNYAEDGKKPAGKFPGIVRKAPVAATQPVVYATWAEGLGGWLNKSGDSNVAAMKSSTAGFVSGVDATVMGMYRFGIAGGYSRSDISVDSRASSLNADSYHISGYAGAKQGAYGLQGGLIYSWNDISSTRAIAFPAFMQTVLASYHAATLQAFGEANYQFMAGATALQAFAGLNYLNHHTGAFSENGGAAALSVSGSDNDVVFTTLGLRASAVLAQTGSFALVGRGTLGWRHAFGNTDTAISAAFAGGAPFSVTGTPIAVDTAYGEAGLDLNINPATTVGVAWSGQFGARADENRLKGQFIYRW